MRILIALAAFPLLTTFAPLALFSQVEPPARSLLAFTRVALDEQDPSSRRVGRLLYLGGWAIRSNDPRFGGISAMHVEDKDVTALSDAGSVLRFSLGSQEASIQPLSAGPGSSSEKGNRDSESLAVGKDRAWVGFEGVNEVWRYQRASWRRLASAAPAAMKKWPENAGSEAMLRLPDGRFLVFSEGREVRGGTEALLFSRDPSEPQSQASTIAYLPPKGYRITDAALLADGRMLFLNRRFALTEGVSAKLTLAPKLPSAAGATLTGVEIAHLRPPLTVDNMEALSVTREGARTIVWIASDDNFNPLQRTLLLKFALIE